MSINVYGFECYAVNARLKTGDENTELIPLYPYTYLLYPSLNGGWVGSFFQKSEIGYFSIFETQNSRQDSISC